MAGTKKKLPPSFPAVQLVCLWALLSACCMAGAVIYDAVHIGDPVPQPASRWATRVPLTEAETMAASATEAAQLWLSAPQATAAALGLLLSPGPRRRALAFLALAATAGSHYLGATLAGVIFVAAPGNYNLVINFVALFVLGGVLDVLAFLALLSSGEEEDETEE